MKNSIYDYTLKELQERLKPSFRAKQVYNWLYKKYVTDFDEPDIAGNCDSLDQFKLFIDDIVLIECK